MLATFPDHRRVGACLTPTLYLPYKEDQKMP